MELAVWRSWWRDSGESELRRVVIGSWDPIGVSSYPEAADEYDGYLGRIAVRLRDGTGTEELARFLTDLTAHMGLDPRPEADLRAAQEIEAWYVTSTTEFTMRHRQA